MLRASDNGRSGETCVRRYGHALRGQRRGAHLLRNRGRRPPLVLHVGGFQRVQDWRREEVAVAQALRGEYRLILLDPRGQGASDKPHDAAAYTFATRVRDVTAVLDAVGVERAHYWGYSLGALVGFGLAAYAPARCAALILAGGSLYGLDPARYAAQAAAYRQVRSMADHVAQREASGGTLPRAARGLPRQRPAGAGADFEAACAYPDLAAVLPTLRTPAFLYAGDADPGFAGVRRAADEIPGATFAALPGLDHLQVLDAGATVLPQVRAFLKQQGYSGIPCHGTWLSPPFGEPALTRP